MDENPYQTPGILTKVPTGAGVGSLPLDSKLAMRDTLEADLPAIFRIRAHPLVAAHQYPLTARGAPDLWREQLFADSNPHVKCTCRTILTGDVVIGHISQLHWRVDDQAVCQLGWNLSPEHWGRGIMTLALTELFDSFFAEPKVNFVIADCFWNNDRCIRLMNKLHFRRIPIALWDRARTALAAGCWRWIQRYELSAARWKEQQTESQSQPTA